MDRPTVVDGGRPTLNPWHHVVVLCLIAEQTVTAKLASTVGAGKDDLSFRGAEGTPCIQGRHAGSRNDVLDEPTAMRVNRGPRGGLALTDVSSCVSPICVPECGSG